MHHIHEMHTARDCDGLVESDQVIKTWGSAEGPDLWPAYMAFVIRFAGQEDPGWTLERTTEPNGLAALVYGGPTEEGFSATEAYLCKDEFCVYPQYRYRDHTAESMGY